MVDMRNFDKLSHVFSGLFGGILLFVLAYITILAPFSVISLPWWGSIISGLLILAAPATYFVLSPILYIWALYCVITVPGKYPLFWVGFVIWLIAVVFMVVIPFVVDLISYISSFIRSRR